MTSLVPEEYQRLERLRAQSVRAFRVGQEAQGNAALTEYIDGLLACAARGAKLQDANYFNAVLAEIVAAQQNSDTVRIADMLQYELPNCNFLPKTIQVQSVVITADCSNPVPPGATLIFTSEATGGSGDYEYQFLLNTLEGRQQTVMQAYSGASQWIWQMPADQPKGGYRVCIWARSKGSNMNLEQSNFYLLDIG